MKEIEIVVHKGMPVPTPAKIDAAVKRCGLVVSMRGSLAKYPGCIHWHLKRGRERGTLEVTIWPAEGRLWLSVQEGRKANWISGAIEQLKAALTSSCRRSK